LLLIIVKGTYYTARQLDLAILG